MPAKNTARIEFDLSAVNGLMETLKGINSVVQSEVLASMVKEGAKPVLRSIKRFVPVRSGDLKASLAAVVRKSRKKGTAVAVIGPSTGRFGGGKKLGKDSSIGSQPSRYAHLPEFGFVGRDGKQVAAHPYMRPGTDAAQSDASAMMVVGFQKGLNKAVAKHVKRISSK